MNQRKRLRLATPNMRRLICRCRMRTIRRVSRAGRWCAWCCRGLGAGFLWLPVDGMGVRDHVTADMVVSQDGMPQAIRLVAQSDANSDTDSDF